MNQSSERYSPSTLTELSVVAPDNHDQQVITFDGNGNANFGGQDKDAAVNFNTANNITVLQVNTARNILIGRSRITGEPTVLIDLDTGDEYRIGKQYEVTPEELKKLVSSN